MTQDSQTNQLRKLIDSILEVIKSAGSSGVPGGTIYAALMGLGASLQQYEALMRVLVNTGYAHKKGDLYYWIKDI